MHTVKYNPTDEWTPGRFTMVMMAALFSLIIILASQPASAQSVVNFIPSEVMLKQRGWVIGYSKKLKGCVANGIYRSGTRITIGKLGDKGRWVFAVVNRNWQSIQSGESYPIQHNFGRKKWKGKGTGISTDRGKGIISYGIKARFIRDFSRSNGLRFRYNGKFVESFSLSGTRDAVRTIKRCYTQRVVKTDPFASSTGTGSDPFAGGNNAKKDPFASSSSGSTGGAEDPVPPVKAVPPAPPVVKAPPKPPVAAAPPPKAVDPAKKLVQIWQEQNAKCSGSTNAAEIQTACSNRQEIGDTLNLLGWCYGREGEDGTQYEWHVCGANSIRPVKN